ncbi:hypothetical protein ACLESO_54180, partial [Pyxidicoccus sp. 3LG]
MRPTLVAPLLLATVLVLAPGPRAWACATCACGDPTLTSMGAEQPFSGRLRLSSTLRAWGHTVGREGEDALRCARPAWTW